MKVLVNIYGVMYELDSKTIENMTIISEVKIGDTYFINSDKIYFSCHENFWSSYKKEIRNNKINSIIH